MEKISNIKVKISTIKTNKHNVKMKTICFFDKKNPSNTDKPFAELSTIQKGKPKLIKLEMKRSL